MSRVAGYRLHAQQRGLAALPCEMYRRRALCLDVLANVAVEHLFLYGPF